jgi:hypothetical protein
MVRVQTHRVLAAAAAFTEDAVLDVDGVVAKAHQEIAKLYTRPEGATPPAATAWQISRRFISSDSGLPDRFDATWKPREHR